MGGNFRILRVFAAFGRQRRPERENEGEIFVADRERDSVGRLSVLLRRRAHAGKGFCDRGRSCCALITLMDSQVDKSSHPQDLPKLREGERVEVSAVSYIFSKLDAASVSKSPLLPKAGRCNVFYALT